MTEVIRHRTAQAAIAHQLRIEILSGKIPPGTRLLQASVAERMKTSTTPVREALRELAADDLVDLDPHRGMVVHQPTEEELAEIYEIRLLLEDLSMRKTVERATEEELDAAERVCDEGDRTTDPSEWVMLNREFHRILAEASRSPKLSAILANLRNRSTLYVALSLREAPGHIRASNEQHRELLAACRARDVDAAVAIVRQHLKQTVELGQRRLEREDDGST